MAQIGSNQFGGVSGQYNKLAKFPTDIADQANSADVNTTPSLSQAKKPKHDYKAEFISYVKKTPAQRLRDDILKKLGLTDADIEKMPPEQRKAVEKQIADEIRRELSGDTSNATQANNLQQSLGALAGQKLSVTTANSLLGLQEAYGYSGGVSKDSSSV